MKPRIWLAIAHSAVIAHLNFLKGRVQHLFSKVDIESCEVVVVACTTWIGSRIAFPAANTLKSQAVQEISNHMPFFLPGNTWGVAVLILGILMGIALLENVLSIRRVLALSSSLFWFYTGVILLMRMPDYYGPGLHVIVGIACLFIYRRLGLMMVDISLAKDRTRVLLKEKDKTAFVFREIHSH